jgi:hypothetical protein
MKCLALIVYDYTCRHLVMFFPLAPFCAQERTSEGESLIGGIDHQSICRILLLGSSLNDLSTMEEIWDCYPLILMRVRNLF